MTQLIIAGIEAVLPQQFSITVKRENPFFTKSGEYTYDCTLRLDNPVNQQLYGFLHRLNKSGQVATRRTAVLMADGHVYCRGTEVITRWTDQTVTVQIVSGESELNYFVGQERKIEDLNLGTVQSRTVEHQDSRTGTTSTYTVFDSDGVYPNADYCRVPVRTKGGGWLNLFEPWDFPHRWPHCPQPYLCLVIRRLMTALGYTVVVNQLEDTIFKNVFLVNTIITNSLSRMLAGWTVKDFLTEVERLTGIVFVTDNTNPQSLRVEILLKTTYYQNAHQLPLNDVVDEYEMEVNNDDSSEAEFTASDVSYQLPEGFWTNLLKLPEGYLEQAHVQDYADLESIMIFNEDGICRDVSTGRMYIRVDREPDPWEIDGQGESYWQEVDQYRDLDRTDSTSTLELKITPAPMGYIGESGVEVIDLGTTDGWHDNISGTVDEETEDEDTDTDLFDSIRSFSKKETSASDLYVAFYVGTVVTYIPTGRQYPMAYTDAYHAAIQQRLHPSSRVSFSTDNIAGSLRLQDLDADHYQGGYQIDTAHAVTFQTFDPNRIDPRQVYVIGNRRFVVRDVEETITAEGRAPLWKLTCYPINISDEAVENRWILTRGVWDDGAAWLDDGRWNDGSNE